MIYHWKSHIAA